VGDAHRLIPPHGGYRKLRTFHIAEAVYDGTVIFCDRFIEHQSRTHDQMVQAGRSCVQNIVEGSMASATSKKMELKLTGVARASLEELLRDYEDFLRQRGLCRWEKDSPDALALRGKYRIEKSGPADVFREADPYGIRSATAEAAANTLICLIHQCSYLLRRQLEGLERTFLQQGGFTERLYRERTAYRRERDQSDKSEASDKSDRSDTSRR